MNTLPLIFTIFQDYLQRTQIIFAQLLLQIIIQTLQHMQAESSKNSFFKKLVEKDKEKTTLLYAKGKENVNSQAQQPPVKKNKRTKTQASILQPTQHQNESHWILDCRHLNQTTINSRNIINNWLTLPSGIVQFGKILQNGHLDNEFSTLTSVNQNLQDNRKSMIVQIWIANSSEKYEFMQTFVEYALPLIKIGKGMWSVAAITHNKRYDLLSLDSEGSQLWKGKTPLSKVQLQRQNLMKRVFGYSIEKEKEIGAHQTLAKVQLLNHNSTVYFILRDPRTQLRSNAQLLVQQEIIIQNITNINNLSILRVEESTYMQDTALSQVLQKLSFKLKREGELSKNERQRFLKAMIEKLQGELEGKQEELKLYKSQKEQADIDEDLGIPSERISMGQERYMQLKRQIKEKQVQ